MRAQETISQGLVFSQKSQQQVLGLYIRRAELAGFIPRKKDYTPRFFCITLEHKPLPPDSSEREKANPTNAYRESLGPSLSGKPQQRFDAGRPPHHYDGLPYVLPLFPITKGTSNFPKFLFDNEAQQIHSLRISFLSSLSTRDLSRRASPGQLPLFSHSRAVVRDG